MSGVSTESVHASCIAIGDDAILLEGPSGAGKSDLALRLIDRGAVLVSDDYTLIERRGDALWARPAPNIAGKIEVRGVGIVDMPHRAESRIALLIALSPEMERYPFDIHYRNFLGLDVPVMVLSPFHASAAIKAEYMLKQALAA